MRCKTCHYSLEGLTEHRCPESGNAFDPKDPSTYEVATASKRGMWLQVLIVAAASYLVTFFLLYRYSVAYSNLVGVQWSQSRMLHDAAMAGLLYIPVGLVPVLPIYMLLKYFFKRRRTE